MHVRVPSSEQIEAHAKRQGAERRCRIMYSQAGQGGFQKKGTGTRVVFDAEGTAAAGPAGGGKNRRKRRRGSRGGEKGGGTTRYPKRRGGQQQQQQPAGNVGGRLSLMDDEADGDGDGGAAVGATGAVTAVHKQGQPRFYEVRELPKNIRWTSSVVESSDLIYEQYHHAGAKARATVNLLACTLLF